MSEHDSYEGPTYYGTPVIKPSIYRWLIALYFWVGGIAGGASLIGTLAHLMAQQRERALVRLARYLTLLATVLSPILLIADLHTPRRFYNMLRIFRRSSPLSVGTWVLTLFSLLNGLLALAHALADGWGMEGWRARAERWLGVPTALLGAFMSVYTATVLTVTSLPTWAALYRQLPPLFATSATATASAALSLLLQLTGGPAATRHRLERLSLIVGIAELLAAYDADRQLQKTGMGTPLKEPRLALPYWGAGWGLGIVLPLLIHLGQLVGGKHLRVASTLAALATLLGGFALRASLIFAGNESARQPTLYFQQTQPEWVESFTGGSDDDR